MAKDDSKSEPVRWLKQSIEHQIERKRFESGRSKFRFNNRCNQEESSTHSTSDAESENKMENPK